MSPMLRENPWIPLALKGSLKMSEEFSFIYPANIFEFVKKKPWKISMLPIHCLNIKSDFSLFTNVKAPPDHSIIS